MFLSTKTSAPTGDRGVSSFAPIGLVFWYIETNGSHYGDSTVYLSIERTDIIQISKVSFYYNRFSTSIPNRRSMG